MTTEPVNLDVGTIKNIIDVLLEKLKEILRDVNLEGVGESFKQIPHLRDNLVTWVTEAMTPGSPQWKEDIEAGFNKILKAWQDTVVKDLLNLELPKYPFMPEDAVGVAKRYMNVNLGFQVTSFIISLVVEVATLGQVDMLHEIISKIDYALGLSRVSSALHEAKFTPALIDPIRQHWNKQYPTAIPGPSDLVNFVVREAFPLDALPEAPEQFSEYMLYHRYSALWSKAYWHAHWRLVSVGDLYDLFHRGEIDATELKAQLVLHDYRPEWTERLLKLSYSLVGRVDLRRAWELGSIDTPELIRRMELTGYSPEDAILEADLQKRVALSAEITKLIDNCRVDFIDGAITEDTARANLSALAVHPEVVEFRIADFKQDYERQRRKERVNIYKDAYRKDLITIEDLEERLRGELTSEDAIQNILEDEWIYKYKKPKEA